MRSEFHTLIVFDGNKRAMYNYRNIAVTPEIITITSPYDLSRLAFVKEEYDRILSLPYPVLSEKDITILWDKSSSQKLHGL